MQPSTSKDSFIKPLDVANKAKKKMLPEVSSTTPKLTLKRKRGLGRDSDDGETGYSRIIGQRPEE